MSTIHTKAPLMEGLLSRTRWLPLTSLMVCLWAANVLAEPADQQSRARSLFQRGVASTESGDYATALTAFEAAYALSPHPATLYNIALSHWALGSRADAVWTMERYLRESDARVAPEKQEQGRAQLQTWLSGLARLQLTLSQSDAELYVDGERTSSSDLILPAGFHHVRVLLAGHRGADYLLSLTPGSREQLNVKLMAAGSSSEMAHLELVVFPYGKAWISGAYAGQSPLSLALPPGAYTVSTGREAVERELMLTLAKGEARVVVVAWSELKSLHARDNAAVPNTQKVSSH